VREGGSGGVREWGSEGESGGVRAETFVSHISVI
jgi:hypothetical protein